MKEGLLSKVLGLGKSVLPFCLFTLLPLIGCTSADKVTKNTLNQEEVMAKMSLEDKAHFVIGVGMAGFSGDDAVIGALVPLVLLILSIHWESLLWYWPTVLPDSVSTLPAKAILPLTIARTSPLEHCWPLHGTRSWLRKLVRPLVRR